MPCAPERENWMNRSEVISGPAAMIVVALMAVLLLAVGWHQEIANRYPVSDLPMVKSRIIEDQVKKGNLSRTEARFYRMMHAGSDTAEIR